MNRVYKNSVKVQGSIVQYVINLLKTNLAVRIDYIDHSPMHVSYKTRLLH